MSRTQRTIPLGQLPVASTALDEEVTLELDAATLTLSMVYTVDDCTYSCCLQFYRVLAHRSRAERYCTRWDVEAYDTVVEVAGSSWLAELTTVAARNLQNVDQPRHFMIYLDSSGSVEVLAQDWALLPPERVR